MNAANSNRAGHGDGIALVEFLHERFPRLRIVVFSMLPEESFAPRALAAGASAYLSKNKPPGDLVTAIKAVLERGKYVSEAQEDLLLVHRIKRKLGRAPWAIWWPTVSGTSCSDPDPRLVQNSPSPRTTGAGTAPRRV